jgi:aminomethyltransferase
VTSTIAAGFMEEAGWWWVTNFGDPDREYRAVREGVGMWDLSPLNKWEFRGPDAAEAVQRVHANDVVGMAVGRVRYGPLLDEDGLLVDDGTVFKHAEDRFWVCTNGNDHVEHFTESTKGLEVEVAYVAPDLPSMQVQGPWSRELLRGLTDAPIDELTYFSFFPEQVEVGGVPVWLSRTGFSGELGYELFLRPDRAVDLWEAVAAAGAEPYGVDVIEPIRVEAGMIVLDYDYAPHERSPYDLGLDRTVALDGEGEFIGKEALRAVAEDPPNRFVTIRLGDGDLPEYGATVTRDGQEVGTLTSPATSPRHGNLGLAIVRRDAAAVGTEVEVARGDGTVEGVVDVLSIDDPGKQKPRA